MPAIARHDPGPAFRAMHRPGDPFILANAWDRGSARMLAALGAQALATSSAAHAFTLGRPDVLPLDDYGVRKGFARTFGRDVLPKPKELAALGEKWRPFRTAASWYLWRALDLDAKG